MLRRLLAGLIALLAGFAVVLTVPLVRIVAADATQTVYADRRADADHYATLAGRDLAAGRTGDLAAELHQYWAVYGIRAWVLTVERTAVVSADGTAPPSGLVSSAAVSLAVQGVQPPPPPPVTPRTPGDLVVAVPVGTGAEAIGALVTVSPLTALRHEVARRWALLLAAEAAVTVALLLAAVPFSRWLLRPVARLDRAAGQIAAGEYRARVGPETGPPELRHLAHSFDRMAAVVERTLDRQQQFVGDASHQLRTPLTSLRLSLENLGALLPPDPADPARAEHDEALEEVRAMGRMLDGLLTMTRLGSEPAEPEDVGATVASARPGWLARCTPSGLSLVVQVEPGLQVLAPPGGLRHLLDELVENACRLSGGTRVTVTARRTGPATAEVTVTDDGRGLDDAGRQAATQRFWRARDQQNTAGSGLGLAIVAELTAAAGGELHLRDAAPGLAVVICLPAMPGSRPASGFGGAEPGDGSGVQPDGPGGDRRPDVDAPAVGMGPELA